MMKWLKKYSKYVMWLFVAIFSLIFNYSWAYETTDLMEQAFRPSMEHEYVLKIWWTTKSQVWYEFLRWWTSIAWWDSSIFEWEVCLYYPDPDNEDIEEILYVYENWKKLKIDNETDCIIAGWVRRTDLVDTPKEAPLIVKITRFLLRITMVLAITMVIFNAVKYMIEVLWWKDRKSAEAKKNLVNIAIWIIVALMSVTIINLIVSVPKSSVKTSNDFSVITDMSKLV